jgi:hypothetical protein
LFPKNIGSTFALVIKKAHPLSGLCVNKIVLKFLFIQFPFRAATDGSHRSLYHFFSAIGAIHGFA